MNIIAIDPGIVTGIATHIDKTYRTFELTPYRRVWELVQQSPWHIVVCENFAAVEISKYGLTTVRIVGGIEAICHTKDTPFVLHQPQDRLPYKDRALQLMIKIYGSKQPRDHQLDALSHLVRWETLNAS